jgi:aspartate/methionine/tyrosine aminotransferase
MLRPDDNPRAEARNRMKVNAERKTAADVPGLLRPPAQRSAIASFIVMDVMREAAEREAAGRGVIHMEVGQPATPAPRAAREAVQRALAADTLGYTLALGMEPLRERIARHYRDAYGVAVPAERVIVTAGSSAAFVLAFLALFDVGARVGLATPGYPCYRHILSALGVGSTLIETGSERRWMPTAESVSAGVDAGNLDGLLIASPANPTGTMLSAQRLEETAHLCTRHRIWFMSDEIYHGLTYEQPAVTALAFSDDVIVINSFSKYFSMTGWRVGWMVVPRPLVRTIERLAQNLYISPPAVAQVAALAAFDGMDELEANRRVYAESRALLLEELPKAGFERLAPSDGAFYLYADVSDLTDDSRRLASQMLDEIGVAATPGIDFDEARGHRYMRFSYAGPTADMVEAARRLKSWRRLVSRK